MGVSLSITDKWANPPKGKIPVSSESDIFFETHSVPLIAYDRTRKEFMFINSLGAAWGDKGFGHVPEEVLEATWWEGWKAIPRPLVTAPPIAGA